MFSMQGKCIVKSIYASDCNNKIEVTTTTNHKLLPTPPCLLEVDERQGFSALWPMSYTLNIYITYTITQGVTQKYLNKLWQ